MGEVGGGPLAPATMVGRTGPVEAAVSYVRPAAAERVSEAHDRAAVRKAPQPAEVRPHDHARFDGVRFGADELDADEFGERQRTVVDAFEQRHGGALLFPREAGIALPLLRRLGVTCRAGRGLGEVLREELGAAAEGQFGKSPFLSQQRPSILPAFDPPGLRSWRSISCVTSTP